MERTVQSMLETTPLRRPRQGTLPTPRMVMPSASTSPTTAAHLGGADVEADDDLGGIHATFHEFTNSAPFGFCMAAADASSSPASPTLPCGLATGQVSARSSRGRSSHPHHDPLGVGLVVEEDDRGLASAARELGRARGRLLELLPVGPAPEMEGRRVLADHEHDAAVVLEVRLLDGVRLGRRPCARSRSTRSSARRTSATPRPVVGHVLGANAA